VARFLAAALAILLLTTEAAAQAPAPVSLDVLLRRVFDYVERFQSGFGSMVAEERYEQHVRGDRAMTIRDVSRVMKSDFLLIKVEGHGWTPFRDVFEVDGRQLRDRQDRLTALFLSGATTNAFEQARRIMDEGARYNLGGGSRNINVPTLPLMYLADGVREGVRFTEGKRDKDSRVIEFTEIARPTLISTGDHDLPATGRVWADEDTGVITRAELDAADTSIQSTVTVTYGFDDKVQSWVPLRMEDRIKRPKDASYVQGEATYSKFRRFKVSTSEDVDTDQLDKDRK
jgi:hypothetical protein